MPAAANITVKAFNGTTDVIYVLKSPAAGDKSPAVWRVDAVGVSNAERPEMRVWSQDSPDGKRRVVKETYVYPVVKLINGVNTVVDYISKTVEFKVPKVATDVDTREAAYQSANLEASALVKSAEAEGFAPA
jgi:hypothetical protein